MVICISICRQHFRRFHTKLDPSPCEHCGKLFNLKEDLKKHLSGVHADEGKYICDICKQKFRRLNSLKAHKLKVHDVGVRYCCSVCQKSYSCFQSLKRHYVKHDQGATEDTIKGHQGLPKSKPLIHVCKYCTKACSTLHELRSHLRQFHGLRSTLNFPKKQSIHKCEICGKHFSHSSALMRHYIVHTGTKPFSCQLCQRKFTFQSSLLRHQQVHTGENEEKRHECQCCGRSFHQLSSLRRHVLIHTNGKPYKCDVCSETFRHTTSRNRHMAREHLCLEISDANQDDVSENNMPPVQKRGYLEQHLQSCISSFYKNLFKEPIVVAAQGGSVNEDYEENSNEGVVTFRESVREETISTCIETGRAGDVARRCDVELEEGEIRLA